MTRPLSFKPALFVLLAALLLVASLFSLTGKPPVWFDEGIYLHAGRVLADEGVFGIQVAPGQFEDLSLVTAGYPLLAPLALVIKFFGASILTGRLLMVFFILGFAGCLFLLTKKMYGGNNAFMSALLLASFAPLYGNGKSVLGEVPGLLFITLGLVFLHSLEIEKEGIEPRPFWKKYLYSLLAGLALGLAASTKPIFLLTAPALATAVIARFRFWKQHLRELLNIAIGFAIPLFAWFGTQFGGEASLEGVFAFYTNPYVLPADTITSIVKTNVLRFFTESTPIHFTLLLVLCAVFFISKFRRKERIYSSEIAIVVFVALVLAAYLRTPGWYRYFFPAHVLLFLFLPAACARIGDVIYSRRRLATRHLAFVVFCLLFVVQLGHFIIKEHQYEKDGTELARIHLATIPAESSVIFYNVSELAFFYPYKNFSQYLYFQKGLELGKESLAKLNRGEFDVVVVPGAYLAEVDISGCYVFEYRARSYVFLNKDSGRCPKTDSL